MAELQQRLQDTGAQLAAAQTEVQWPAWLHMDQRWPVPCASLWMLQRLQGCDNALPGCRCMLLRSRAPLRCRSMQICSSGWLQSTSKLRSCASSCWTARQAFNIHQCFHANHMNVVLRRLLMYAHDVLQCHSQEATFSGATSHMP